MSTAADLRTLVVRRCGTNRRVALLSADPGLKRGLEANGCTVLADPAGFDELSMFRPQVVVAFDGLVAEGDGAEAFKALTRIAPEADLLFSFANAASASALVGALLGTTPNPALSVDEVTRWLRLAGLVVAERDVVVMPHQKTTLSADAEAAFRALCEQLNPDAAADRFLIVARRGVTESAVDPVEGQVSVVVQHGGDLALLERTLFSLAGQWYQPLEVLVQGPDEARAVFERHRAVGGYRGGVVRDGLHSASGQYLALLQAGDVVYPQHFGKLVATLQKGTAAWALARTRRTTGTAYVTAKREPVQQGQFSSGVWLRAGAWERCAWLIDRTRLGKFAITLPAEAPAAEAVLFARLCAVFPPAFVPGVATSERYEGSTVPGAQLLDALKGRPLRLLTSLDELMKGESVPPRAVLVEKLNDELKKRAPQLHAGLKQLAQKLGK